MRLGVVADDLTGAGDLGGMTAGAGYLTHIYPWDAFPTTPSAEVCIIDTDSRLDAPDAAYEKVYAATRALRAAGCQRFFNKTCSVFRGNIGREFDAMLDALGEPFALVVLGFPRNGRLTVDGIHYVHGERLGDSPFRHDPVHPMTRSSLVEILQSQTPRPVAHLGHAVMEQGAAALRAAIHAKRRETTYLILDVPDQQALATIAEAAHELPVLCGSSALAETLPAHWPPPSGDKGLAPPPPDGRGVLCVAGSLTPQTKAQTTHLAAAGVLTLRLDTLRLLDTASDGAALLDQAVTRLKCGQPALLHAAHDPETLKATRAAGAALGLSPYETARRVSSALAGLAADIRTATGFSRLVVAGGDTSAAVCRALGVRGLQVGQELAPGLPWSLSLPQEPGETPLLLVLKSGSFGGPDFLEMAVRHLERSHP